MEAFAFFTYCALFNQSILLYGFQDMWGANPSTPDAPQEGMVRDKMAVARDGAFILGTDIDGMTVTMADLDQFAADLKKDLDSMAELTKDESLRLQMAMERLAALQMTLDNLLQSASDSSNGITENLK